jgi:hypothetical protein
MINSLKSYLPYVSQGVLKKKIKLLNQKGNLCFRKYVAISFSIPFSERVSAEPKGVCYCEEQSDEAISFFLNEIATGSPKENPRNDREGKRLTTLPCGKARNDNRGDCHTRLPRARNDRDTAFIKARLPRLF